MTDKRNNSIKNTNEPENSNMEEDDVNISIEVSGNFTTASSNSRRCDQHESEDMEASNSRIGSKAEVDALPYDDSKMSKGTDCNSVDKSEHVQTEINVSSIPVSAFSNQTDSLRSQHSCSPGQENVLLNQEVCTMSDSYKSNASQVQKLERNPIAANSDRELKHISPSSDSEKGLKKLLSPSEICVKPERQKCEKSADVQNCRVDTDEKQRRIYENVDHSNYVGSKSDEQNKITESPAEIKEDTKTIENDRHKMQQPIVDKQHLSSSSDKSKIDINIENSKNSKDKGQELYTHTKTQYKATSTLTDGRERVENSNKDNDQELCTGTKTDCKTAITGTDGTVNTPETDENAKAALEKARKWNTCDDEEYDMVYVYNYKKDNGFIEACEKYVYFWKNKDIYSQWHKSTFVVNDKTFNCAEQFMMYKKAELFEDTDIAKKILSEKSPRIIKSLGRKVKNFSEELWAANCLYVVKQANIAKFSQDEHFKKKMFTTYPKLLVEASPLDKIWGIGLAEDDCKAWDEAKWRGKNLLGYILTEVRDELMFEAGKIQKHERKVYLESLTKVLIQEASQSKTEYKAASKNTEQSEKKFKGNTNPRSKGQDVVSKKPPPSDTDDIRLKEDPKFKTGAVMETENELEKRKHENSRLRQTSTKEGQLEDEIEKPDIDSSREQGSNDKWYTESLGQSGTRKNPAADVDRNSDSLAETEFHPEESKEPSGCQQEKETLVKYNKCDGNKGISPGPLCDSLQLKESFGRQGDKETVVEKDGCDRNKAILAGPELSSEQNMETIKGKGDKRTVVKENECQRNIESKQDGTTYDEQKSLELV